MDEEKTFSSMRALKKKMDEERKRNYEDSSKERLAKIVETKLKTSFIGALSHFEEYFGFLWGHESGEDITEEQEFMKEVWEKARTAVLNNGNNQIRACKTEIEQYNISWNRYQATLPVVPIKRNLKEEKDGQSDTE